MLRWLKAVAVAVLLAVPTAAQAAEKRIALVIGNANYTTVPRLPNASNDARAIGQTLKSLGFQVELALNQPANNLRDTVQRFSRQSAAADVAFVFYAGHGVEVGGRNYLVPVDAHLKTDMDVVFEAISLDLVMQAVEPAKSLRIIVLDACRDNPFVNRMTITSGGSRGIGHGLARVDPPGDTLVAYAAKAGSTALDGTGPNSPFTTALLKHMPTPGLEIGFMFRRVRDTVMELTNRQQEPFVYGSVGAREIYLSPLPGGAPAQPSATSSAPAAPDSRVELSFWESVRGSTSTSTVQSYLDRYPNGSFASLARARIQELEQSRHAKLQTPASGGVPNAGSSRTFFVATGSESLRIAVAGPMTGSDSVFGARIKAGVDQAVVDINATGGILGRQVTLLVGDDYSNPRLVGAVTNKLATDGAKFVVGHYNPGITMPASEAYQQKGILQITPSASNPEFTERGMWNVFRTCGRDDQQGAVAGAYIAQRFKGKRVAILHDRTAYGQGLADEVRKAISAKSVREVLYEGLSVGEKDFSAVISRIRASGADLVYWGGLSTEGALLLRQMRTQGVEALLMGGDGITSDEFAGAGGPGVEGTLMTHGPDPSKRPEARTVVQKLRAKRIEPDAYTLHSYAAVQIIKQAAEAAKSLEPVKVADQIKTGMKFRTVIGDISFDKKGDVTSPNYAMHVWKKDAKGKIVYSEIE
jgi:branched-chain amino acid transport system substrate-binding protein